MKIRNREDLIEYVNHKNKVKYLFFWGHTETKPNISKSFFSQWYDSPYQVEGQRFLTAEHHMMHQKALLFGDADAADRLLGARNPGEAKAIGRQVVGFDQELWNKHRFSIVVKANVAKFGSHPELQKFLIGTGKRVLVEASPVDKIWGIGMAADNPNCENPNKWKGLNLLGFALMEARDELA